MSGTSLQFGDGSAVRTVVSLLQTQTLQNKTLGSGTVIGASVTCSAATFDIGDTTTPLSGLVVKTITIKNQGAGTNPTITCNSAGQTVTFSGGVSASGFNPTDGSNFSLGSTTGSKIGTATTQKLGFFNATPIVQPSDIVALTDNSGGTANDTLEAISAVFVQSEIRNNFADLAAKVNSIRTTLRNLGLMA